MNLRKIAFTAEALGHAVKMVVKDMKPNETPAQRRTRRAARAAAAKEKGEEMYLSWNQPTKKIRKDARYHAYKDQYDSWK